MVGSAILRHEPDWIRKVAEETNKSNPLSSVCPLFLFQIPGFASFEDHLWHGSELFFLQDAVILVFLTATESILE